MQKLNPRLLPSALVRLLPIAEKWGIGDDCEREHALATASPEELESLVHSVDGISDKDLYGWLSGPQSYDPKPTQEYLAITALTMAIDSAKLKLRKLRGR